MPITPDHDPMKGLETTLLKIMIEKIKNRFKGKNANS